MAALFSPPTHLPNPLSSSSSSLSKTQFPHKPRLLVGPKNPVLSRHFFSLKASPDNGAGALGSAAAATTAVEEPKVPEPAVSAVGPNGSVHKETEVEVFSNFEDPKWVNGTWDLTQFQKDGKTDWDAVIDAGEISLLFYFLFFIFYFLGLNFWAFC